MYVKLIINDKDISIEEQCAMGSCIIIPFEKYTNNEIRDMFSEYKHAFQQSLSGNHSLIKKFHDMVVNHHINDTEKVLTAYNKHKGAFTEYIPYVSVLATEWCNLNCARCGAGMPIYNLYNKHKEMSLEEVTCIFNRYNELSEGNYIRHIDIVGGEPLLHSNIRNFTDIIRQLNPKSRIVIISNGLLIPTLSDYILDSFRDNNIYISVSIYGHGAYFYNINLNPNSTEILTSCNECSGHSAIYYSKMKKSSIGSTFLLSNGDLYYCGFVFAKLVKEHFGIDFDIIKGRDYINIFEVDTFDDILKFMQQPSCNFAKYCGIRDVVPWELSNRDKYEWIKKE